MTIHSEHPFADPTREAARQLRGRLGGRVGLLTTGEGRARVGWTVSSLAVVSGEPWRVVAFVDPDSDFAEHLVAGHERGAGSAVLQLLQGDDRYLADAFAGLAPAPGGVFTLASWEQTDAGPRLAHATTWATLALESHRELGWQRELVFTIGQAVAGPDDAPLHHVRGRYTVPSH